MKSPLAKPGVKLPNGLKLRKSKIRGVVSNGMLCSAVELGLGDESDGIIALPDDAEVGSALATILGCRMPLSTLDLTPNRGDCFSVLGIARDVSALTGETLRDTRRCRRFRRRLTTHIRSTLSCPKAVRDFAGRVIRNIDPTAKSPVWMSEKLRRSGLRAIHPVVDVTNYVMLELGQPLHAYDLGLVKGPIRPRLARRAKRWFSWTRRKSRTNDDTLVIR